MPPIGPGGMFLPDDAFVVILPIPGGFRYLSKATWVTQLAKAQLFESFDAAEKEATRYDGTTSVPLQVGDHLLKGRLRWKGYVCGKLYRIERGSDRKDVVRLYKALQWTIPKSPPIDPSTLRLIYETFLRSFTVKVPEVVPIDFTSPFFEVDVKTRWPKHHLRWLADSSRAWLLQGGSVAIVLQHTAPRVPIEETPESS